MAYLSSIQRNIKEIPKPKDQSFNKIYKDIYKNFENTGIDIASMESFKPVWANKNRWAEYIEAITGDIQNESAKEAISVIMEHQMEMLNMNDVSMGYQDESGVAANVHMYSYLNGPVIRALWARAITPMVMRTVPLRQTNYTATFDVPYLMKNGKRYDLPYSLVDEEEPVLGLTELVPIPATEGGAAHIDDNSFVLFTNNTVSGNIIFESIPASTIEDFHHVDARISIDELIVTGLESDGTTEKAESTIVVGIEPSTKTGKAAEKLLSREVEIPSDADPLTGVIFVNIDLDTGKYTAATTSPYIKGFKLSARLSSENNKSAATMRTEQHAFEVNVGNGEHVHIDTPVELLQDYSLAHAGADYVVAMTDVISEFYSGLQNQELLKFLKISHTKVSSAYIPNSVLRLSNQSGEFDIRVAFGENPAAYTDVQFKRGISWYINNIRSITRIEDGFWSIVGHANNVMYIPDFKTEYFGRTDTGNEEGAGEVYGFKVGYTIGFTTNVINGKVRCLYSPEIKMNDGLIGFFSSTDDKRPTYVYHPYSYTVSRGYQNPSNQLVPSVMVTKRHRFVDFVPSQFRIKILGNTGDQFKVPKSVGLEVTTP